MKKLSLLNISQYFCIIAISVLTILLIILLIGFIKWNIYPFSTFNDAKFSIPKNNSNYLSVYHEKFHYITVKKADKNGNEQYTLRQNENELKGIFFLNDLHKGFIYFMFFKITILLLFVIFSLKEFLKVISLSKDKLTFSERNIKAFQRIGFYCLAYTIVSIPTILIGENIYFWSINLNLLSFVIMILAFIMADVYKEGNKLYDDNKLTI